MFFTVIYAYAQPDVSASKGVLNLQNRNWAQHGPANLNGEWAFYWNKLYSPSFLDTVSVAPTAYAEVPGFWNNVIKNPLFKPAFGFATYRLKVNCPPSAEPLKLKMLTVASAYTLFVNGKQVAKVGNAGTSASTTVADFQPVIVPVMPENNKLDIVVQVANYSYSIGGLWDFIKLGTATQIDNYHVKSVAQDFFIAGSFFLIGIFYLVIYFFFRRSKSPLYFAVFCILIGIRPLVTGNLGINYFTNWNWQVVKHLEFICLYLTVPVAALFSYELFPSEFPRKILRYIIFISVPFVMFALFTSPFIFHYTLRPFQVFMVATAIYGLYVYTCAVLNKRIGSAYFLAGFIILFVTVVNDILYTSLLIKSTNMLYFGIYVLIICQATALSKQFFRAYSKIENLNKKLEQINEELNVKNDTIHKTNEQLNTLNAELDTLIFRTSHDLRSPITSVLTMADIIKMEEDTDRRSEYIDYQKKTLNRLNGLINEILDYSKNKSTALRYEPIDFEDFVKNAMQDHLFAANSKNIQRIIEISQSAVFESDKARLGMVLHNLISNGLKHHNVEQENPYLKIVVKATEKEATIAVMDNGPGIPQQHLNNIFTKFYRVNTNLNGFGFGLYIVKEAIEKLGGTIYVESTINEGTSFIMNIPNGELK